MIDLFPGLSQNVYIFILCLLFKKILYLFVLIEG